MTINEKLVYIGLIQQFDEIPNADFIHVATVVCGKGGKWRGIVRKADFSIGDLCVVYLPDAQILPNDNMKFMEASNWRVKMRRFKGAPSEVVIMPYIGLNEMIDFRIGDDITQFMGVTKYHKPIPANLAGKMKGPFPGNIPKTDEPNYQTVPEIIEMLKCNRYYITEKCDGSSTTAFKLRGEFRLCSRNWELLETLYNGYWDVANKYDLKNKLPEGIVLQWETCGPGIQSNPMGLKEIDGFAFSGYNITEHRYLDYIELMRLCHSIGFPMASILEAGDAFDPEGISTRGEGFYSNGKPREGIVVRSQDNVYNGKPISFKVINLDYDT